MTYKCNYFNILLFLSFASFVTISLPLSSIVLHDYHKIQHYTQASCNGTSISNFTIYNKYNLFYKGTVNLNVTFNKTLYNGLLYYPPIQNWAIVMDTKYNINKWYKSLSKNSSFVCYIDLNNLDNFSKLYYVIEPWMEVFIYYILLSISLAIISGYLVVLCFTECEKVKAANKKYNEYIDSKYSERMLYTNKNVYSYFKDPGVIEETKISLLNNKYKNYSSLNNTLSTIHEEHISF